MSGCFIAGTKERSPGDRRRRRLRHDAENLAADQEASGQENLGLQIRFYAHGW